MISQRLRGVREDGEAIEEEGFMPKLQAMFSEVGISIEDQNGELRSTFDILNDLAGVWDQLSSKQKQYFGEKVAGNRQVKTLNAIMQNWDVVADTIDKANESQGAAIEGNEMYMESIAGKITQLKSAWQELATTTINGDFVKGFVELGTAIVKLTTNMGGLIPVASTLLGIFMMFKGKAIADGFAKLLPALTGVFTTIRNGTPVLQAFMGLLNTPIGVIGGLMALVGVFTAIVSAVNKAYYSLEKFEKAKSAYEEHSSKVNELNEELKNTENAIDTLKSKDSLTIVEQAELDRLKETNGELERQLEIEEKLKEISESDLRNEAVKAAEKYNDKSSDSGISIDMINSVGADTVASIVGLNTGGMDVAEIAEQLVSRPLLTNLEKAKLDMELLKKAREDYNTAYEAFLEASPEDTDATNKYQKEMEDRAKEIESLQIGLNTYNESVKGFTAGLSRTEEDSEFNALLDIEEQIDNLITDDSNISFEEAFNKILNKYSDATEVVKEKVQELGDAFTLDSLKDAVNELGEDVDFGALVNEIATKLDLTHDEVEQLFKETFSFDSTSITPSFNIGLDEITLFSTTESYKNLTAAMTEQQKAGVLSYETIQALLSDEGLKGINDYLIQTADGYMLNTDTIYDFIKAEQEESKLDIVEGIMERQIRLEDLQEQVDSLGKSQEDLAKAEELQGEISGIQSEITQLQAAAIAADDATSALERYRVATKTANQDAEQDEGEGAFKTVQERYKEGKIGTDEFKEGMNFLLGDNWLDKDKFEGSIDKAYKEAERIGKRYFGDNDAKSADSFRKDLIDNNLATYDEASGKLTLVQNDLATIAETLGISEDAAESLFGLLNSYSPDDQFNFDRPIATAEQLAAAEAKLKELEEERARLQKEIDEGNAAGEDTSDLQKQLEENNAEAEKLQGAITTAKEAGSGISEEMSIDEAIDKITVLESAIKTFEEHGITATVEMSGDYDELSRLLYGTDSEGNPVDLSISVDGIEDAKNQITEIDESISHVKKLEEEGKIEPEIAAKITGDLVSKKEALETYVEKAEQIKRDFPNGDLSATITVSAEDNATPTINFVNQELFGEGNGGQGLDGKTATATVDAKDKASDEIENVGEELTDLNGEQADTTVNAETTAAKDNLADFDKDLNKLEEEPHEATVGAKSDEDSITNTKSEIEEGTQPDDPALVDVGLNQDSKTQFESDLNDLLKGRDLEVTVKYVDGNGAEIELGDRTTPEDVVAGTGNVISKSENGNYLLQSLSQWASGLVQKYKELGLGGPTPKDIELEAQEVTMGDNASLEASNAVAEAQNSADYDEGFDLWANQFPGLDGGIVDKNSIEEEVGEAIEEGADEAKPETTVNPETDKIPEEIEEATPDEVTPKATPDVSEFPKEIEDAAPDSVEVPIEPKPGSTPPPMPMPEHQTGGAGGKNYAVTTSVNADTSEATSQIGAVTTAASGSYTMEVGADTSDGEKKVDSLDSKAAKPVTKPIGTSVDSRNYDALKKDIDTKKTQEVEVKYTEVNKPDDITKAATGTKNAPGGISLVDEKGAELIEHTSKGTFELGTNNGARFTKLNKGDVVHTASETKRILSRMGKIGGFFRDGLNQAKSIFGNAFAEGSGKTVTGSATLKALERVLGSVRKGSSGQDNGNRKKSGKNSDKALKKFEKWAAKLFDWAEVRLDRLKTITNTFLIDATNAIGAVAKNKQLDSAIKSVNKEISATTKAYDLYLKTADSVAKKGKLSKKIIEKVKDGSIEIEKYSPNLQKKIKQYEEWYGKAMDCVDALQDLNDQQKELAKTELENIVKYYESKSDSYAAQRSQAEAQRELNYEQGITDKGAVLGTKKATNGKKVSYIAGYGDYQTDIDAENDNYNNLIEERQQLQKKFNDLMNQGLVVEGDDTWIEYTKQLEDLDTRILKSHTDIIKLKDEAVTVNIDQIGYQIDSLATSVSQSIEQAELAIARGSKSMDKVGNYYQTAIDKYNEGNKALAEQNKWYRIQQRGLDETSAKYQELQKKIDQNTLTMNQNSQSAQEYADKINQIKFDKIAYKLDALSDGAAKLNDSINIKLLTGSRITESIYKKLINNANKRIKLIKDEKAEYERQNKEMVALYGKQAKQSTKYKENEKAIRELDAEQRQLTQSTLEWEDAIENIPVQELDWKIAGNEANINKIQETIENRKAAGQSVGKNWYNNLINSANSEIQNLEEQNKLYEQQRKGMDVNSQAYQKLTDKIRDNNSKIRDLTKSTYEWKDSINQISLDKYAHDLDVLKAKEEEYNDIITEREAKGLRITKSYYQNLINNNNKQIDNINEQIAYYKALMEELINLYGVSAKQSDKYKEYENAVADLENTVRDTRVKIVKFGKEMQNLAVQELAWELDDLAASADRMNKAMSLHEAQGIEETSDAYKNLINNGMRQIQNLEKQNALYKDQQKGMDIASKEYQELESKIRGNTAAIDEMKVSQEQWNDSIIDIGIGQIEKQKDMLAKTNEEYERQKELQKSLLNLEKARTQRKIRTYVEGQGFVYQSSEEDLREAQEALEDVISNQLLDRLDTLIDALEESKNDSNVYDANGNLLGKSYSTPQLGTLTNVLSNYDVVRNAGLDIAVLKDSLGKNILNTAGTNTSSTSFSIGDIIVNEAKDGNELAQAIVNQFPNALLQALYKK